MKASWNVLPNSQISTPALILILLGIRLLYSVLAVFAIGLLSGIIIAILNLAYIVATYIVTALLIWRTRRHLSEYRVGKLAVSLFILSVPYQLLLGWLKFSIVSPFPLMQLLMLPAAFWLAVALLRDKEARPSNPPALGRWLLLGTATGIFGGSLVGLLISLQSETLVNLDALLPMMLLPTVQISIAAVSEEPLFRGFLWGYLQKLGWQDRRIWLFQAFLFGVAHLYYLPLGDYFSFVTAFLGGLVIGWVGWKAQDIAASMLAHGFFNGMAQIVGELASAR